MNNNLIYGKDPVQRIVGSEVKGNFLINYIADGEKTVTEKRDFYYYVLLEDYDDSRECGRLGGENDFQYFVKFKTKNEAYQYCRNLEYSNKGYWRCYNDVESAMLREGFTQYKGMKLNDVSVLSFDIETTGVTINGNSFITLISNTLRSRSGLVHKRMFAFDDYDSPKHFIDAWCQWVRSVDPDIMVGHNIFAFDFPYLAKVAKLYKTKINLGRNASAIKIASRPRKFRKDGSQAYDYNNVNVYGRQVVDTFFLSMKYDIARNYPSYGLKAIIDYEGLEKENRQHWDFSKNKEPWTYPDQWKKFKQYAEDDADDALALFDLMAPQFFYYAQSIPKPFQEIINTATGSQVNAFMVRAYLQDSLSIPAACEKQEFEGAISIGNPGLYKNVFKIDVASLYPSIMLQYNITDSHKDPDNRFIEAVKFFTEQRLEDKRLAAETGERIYSDLSNGRKIMINSFYGFMGAPGLNFNYPEGAAEVTRRGREILKGALIWAKSKRLKIVNADTDSISYEAPENANIEDHLKEINSIYKKKILWENDGVYESVLVVKIKNYALKQDGKIIIKGSALKATMKETALKTLLSYSIDALLQGHPECVCDAYHNLARLIGDLTDISPWCSKITVTSAVLNPKRSQEERVLAALKDENIQEGDKYRLFFETDTTRCLDKNFKGVYDKDKLYEKLFKTVKVLAPVLDMESFPNYKLKNNKEALKEL